MTIDQYYQSFYELLRESKTVGHLELDRKNGGTSYGDFCNQICELLAKFSDDDFSTFATKLKFSKHFNVIIQAQVAAVNRESRRRGFI
jgi:hypothetical protein